MNTTVKVSKRNSQKIIDQLNDHPYFTINCNLSKILKSRGMTLKELSLLTGIRVASLSELANVKRTTLQVPHILVIAKALRIVDISELFEFSMPEETLDQFKKDRAEIGMYGMTKDQQDQLTELKQSKKPPTV